MEYLILWFDVDGEMVATNCSWRDFERGTVELKLCDERRDRSYSIGYRSIKNCVDITKFFFFDKSKAHLMTWNDRDKLFKKYPELKELVA